MLISSLCDFSFDFSPEITDSKYKCFPQNPPLYLHVTSTTKEGLDKAVEKIEELMKQELGSLVDERRFRRREPVEQLERDEFGRVRRCHLYMMLNFILKSIA